MDTIVENYILAKVLFFFFFKLGDLEQHIYFFTVFKAEKFKILAPAISYLVKWRSEVKSLSRVRVSATR